MRQSLVFPQVLLDQVQKLIARDTQTFGRFFRQRAFRDARFELIRRAPVATEFDLQKTETNDALFRFEALRKRQEVRRDERLWAKFVQHVEHQFHNSFAFGRIRARTKFVQENHGHRRETFKQRSDTHHFHAETSFGLVGFGAFDERCDEARGQHDAGDFRRNKETILRQKLGQSQRLQKSCFAARVWPGNERRRCRRVDDHGARDRRHAIEEQKRIKKAMHFARFFRLDDLRQANLKSGGSSLVAEAKRAQVKFDVAEELNEGNDLRIDAGKYGIDEAGEDFAAAELVTANKKFEDRKPTAPEWIDKRVFGGFFNGKDIEGANFAVGADADLEVQRGELLVVTEQIPQRSIRFAANDGRSEFM